ncbi:uroporphyrinogen-III synthase [Lentisphaerota bacterium ZTH]|nr:uroporphyrinogen-III synthase [Lentisphaerota bacterium]WET07551.1 uroporphyrinogen-III synthase [Lentisphaerota bacterium ZTH]
MNDLSSVLAAGARNSRLSIAQTREAFAQLRRLVPSLKLSIVPMSSPGDRDRETDLRLSDPDFFTRDLDQAVINGNVDCAVHSAKDLPEALAAGLDMLILPWSADPRDVLIVRKGETIMDDPRIGVSSERRDEYCARRFPEGRRLPVRGNIEHRIEQLDNGKYDVLIMAAAGLKRLGLEDRITEYIPLDEMPVPELQGKLAFTFKTGHPVFTELRKLFVKPVIFAGAGVGSAGNATVDAIKALRECDICLYDALCPHELLDELPPEGEAINVGKRSGMHAATQPEICQMLIDFSRKNKRIVRLKGGDPGIFGRLAEEVTALNEYSLPYKVLPGVSSLSAATTGTGLLLTQRDQARGFIAATPRRAISGGFEWFDDKELRDFPKALFMATGKVEGVIAALKAEGKKDDYPVTVVFDAGSPDLNIVCGSLGSITSKLPAAGSPGIILTGVAAKTENIYAGHGALRRKQVLFAGSGSLLSRAEKAVTRFGGKFHALPMIKLESAGDACKTLEAVDQYEWLVVTSPSCAEILFENIEESGFDLRRLPKLAVCGSGTAAVFKKHGIIPEACPEKNYGGEALIKSLQPQLTAGTKVLRLRSDLATKSLAEKLQLSGAEVTDKVFYCNRQEKPGRLPEFEVVMFTSSSCVESFVSNYGAAVLNDKKVCVIGPPTAEKAEELLDDAEIIEAGECTVEAMALSLAAVLVSNEIKRYLRS